MKSQLTEKHLIVTADVTGEKKPWAAIVAGLDDEKGLDRRFIGVSLSAQDATSSVRMATVKLARIEDTVYELGHWAHDDNGQEKRYYILMHDNKPQLKTLSEVRALFQEVDAVTEDVVMPF